MTGKLVTLIGMMMMMTVVVPAVISQHMESYVTVKLQRVQSAHDLCTHER